MANGFRFQICSVLLAGVLCAPAVAQTSSQAQSLGDATVGRGVFQKECGSCHQVGESARNGIGPQLNRVFDRAAGSVEGARYSQGMERMGRDGLIWTLTTLDAYIENPRALVSGTRMSYRGLKDPEARANVIAYLRTYSDQPQNIPESSPTARPGQPELSADVLAIVGDREYGEYLAAECLTCHQRSGGDLGIPAIVNWPQEDFVIAMHAYKQELRPHQVMQMMAKRLDDEQIASLAAYFETLGD